MLYTLLSFTAGFLFLCSVEGHLLSLTFLFLSLTVSCFSDILKIACVPVLPIFLTNCDPSGFFSDTIRDTTCVRLFSHLFLVFISSFLYTATHWDTLLLTCLSCTFGLASLCNAFCLTCAFRKPVILSPIHYGMLDSCISFGSPVLLCITFHLYTSINWKFSVLFPVP